MSQIAAINHDFSQAISSNEVPIVTFTAYRTQQDVADAIVRTARNSVPETLSVGSNHDLIAIEDSLQQKTHPDIVEATPNNKL